jgi:integrase
LRQAKSLFAPGAIKHLSLSLPSPLPFEGIAFEPRQSMRYRSHIDPAKLAQAAQKELATDDPPAFLAFLLALGAGLRRIEIDRLEWAAFRFRDNVIRIEPTRYFDVKTEHSIGDVQVDPELMAVFRGYFARAGSNFVIEGGGPPIPEASREHYRAQAVFERLSAWLRGHSVTARKPIHELRKEFGSMLIGAETDLVVQRGQHPFANCLRIDFPGSNGRGGHGDRNHQILVLAAPFW